ncbi:MAG TPA: HipA domain-containing protein [Caulobacteraceae bacterium]
MTISEVTLWGTTVGAVALNDGDAIATFQFAPEFIDSGIQISPIVMPLSGQVYYFPELPIQSFHGLPGLLADSLPDRYGNALIDAWLASQGRDSASFNAVERLCYTGARGMGALEFRPSTGPHASADEAIKIDALVKLASEVLTQRDGLHTSFGEGHEPDALRQILRVGTSAGGARAKAVIAWNPVTHEVRSGQARAGEGFQYWLLKFDGVEGNKDKELADPKGYGAVEYAYSEMAKAAGITMTECRLLEEGGRRHFMTRRFDRLDGGEKLHMQSLAALGHLDFNDPMANSYEQAFLLMRRLGLSMQELEQFFRRIAFNVIARNHDDHVKNVAFLMDRAGAWRLAPAFDLTWAYNPTGAWTNQHQMSINGKRNDFEIDDLVRCAEAGTIKPRRSRVIIEEVWAAVSQWPDFASRANVTGEWRRAVGATLRLDLRKGLAGS